MRLYCVIVLVGGLLIDTTEAHSPSKQIEATKADFLDAPQWASSFHDTKNTRSLRERNAIENYDEERALSSVTALFKKLGGKLKRLAVYNYWIFTNKKPADVVKNDYYKGYWNFYYNRMVRGGKYA
ncbi:RxLR effector protein [Phytophthora megakarya]|uniref:RxLR effector protein n=1 Tax=Phytophthora megakarya TaxID=4795 RepID=A0A225W939_9STRA|nr:RxLR effector protein [Phytophthora megakarya]